MPAAYGNDRLFIDLRTEGEDDAAQDEKLDRAGKSRASGGAHR